MCARGRRCRPISGPSSCRSSLLLSSILGNTVIDWYRFVKILFLILSICIFIRRAAGAVGRHGHLLRIQARRRRRLHARARAHTHTHTDLSIYRSPTLPSSPSSSSSFSFSLSLSIYLYPFLYLYLYLYLSPSVSHVVPSFYPYPHVLLSLPPSLAFSLFRPPSLSLLPSPSFPRFAFLSLSLYLPIYLSFSISVTRTHPLIFHYLSLSLTPCLPQAQVPRGAPGARRMVRHRRVPITSPSRHITSLSRPRHRLAASSLLCARARASVRARVLARLLACARACVYARVCMCACACVCARALSARVRV